MEVVLVEAIDAIHICVVVGAKGNSFGVFNALILIRAQKIPLVAQLAEFGVTLHQRTEGNRFFSLATQKPVATDEVSFHAF